MAKTKVKTSEVMALGAGVGGGVIGNRLSVMSENSMSKMGWKNATTLAPIPSAIIGVMAALFAKNDNVKALGAGMLTVAGTLAVEDIITGAAVVPPPSTLPAQGANVRQMPVNSAQPRTMSSRYSGYGRAKSKMMGYS